MLTLHLAMETKHSSSSSSSSHYYYCAEQLLTLITAMACLLLAAFLMTAIRVAADEFQYFPSSNVHGDLFSYYRDTFSDSYFRLDQMEFSTSTILSCSNSSFPQALSLQGRLYGRSIPIYSAHTSLDLNFPYFRLYFVISGEDFCSRSNGSTPSYYLSLVVHNIYPDVDSKVVWTANVGNPVGENACLHLSPDDTNLKLVDYDRNASDMVVWQTNTFGHTNASLTITYEGNLVLFTNTTGPSDSTLKQNILWQSYDHPTDTLMVLQALRSGMNLTAASTSKSVTSNKTASHTLGMENGTLKLYTKIQYKALYNTTSWTAADYSGYGYPYLIWSLHGTQEMSLASFDHAAAALCWYPDNSRSLQLDIVKSPINGSTVISKYNQISPDACVWQARQPTQTIFANSSNLTYATFLKLESDGDLHAYTETEQFTSLSESGSINPCHFPLICGFYGVCDKEKRNCTQNCGGSNELELQDSKKNAKLGCKFKEGDGRWEPSPSSSCGDGSTNHKKPNASIIAGATYFSNALLAPNLTGIDAQACWENHCKDDCACTAAFWESKSNGSCFLIHGPVATIIFNASATKDDFMGYLKFMENATKPSLSKPIAIGVSLGFFVLILAVFVGGGYIHRRRRLKARELEDYEIENELLGLSLLGSKPQRFTWKEMHEYTCGFSDPLGGGGFGTVFRGSLDDGTPVAVKQLIDGSHQGRKEFMAEVSILGRTHHLQLVRLIGFCLEGAVHKLLVYEYMENGSLDAWIFSKSTPESQDMKAHKKCRPILSWERRFDIALGTAKGLAYLHEECEDRIIHMDLKPQNILLGADFFPKISDFGMSRRVVRDQQSAVVTMMRGTPGYLAPEWLTEGAITEKCDVYSYGIMLLEILSGSRVKDWTALRQKLEMRSNRGEGVMELVDERLMNYGMGGKIYDEVQAMRMVDVAMLCVQSNPRSRPSMSSVVQMLEGKVGVIPQAPIDDYEQMGLFPSEKIMSRRKLGLEDLELEQDSHPWAAYGEYWKSGGDSTMTSKSRKSILSSKTSYKYMEISRSQEYMDAL